jgi:hypothetical protein
LKPAPGKIVHETLSWKNPSQKNKKEASGVAKGVGPEFKLQNGPPPKKNEKIYKFSAHRLRRKQVVTTL